MRKSLYILPFITIILLTGGCPQAEDQPRLPENQTVYTYEELAALPGDQLLPLFIENGLEINEQLREVFTEDELQEFFKSEFEQLHQGFISRNDLMYWDLADKTAEVYQKLTNGN